MSIIKEIDKHLKGIDNIYPSIIFKSCYSGGSRICIEKENYSGKQKSSQVKAKMYIDKNNCFDAVQRGVGLKESINTIIAHEIGHVLIFSRYLEDKEMTDKRNNMDPYLLNIAEDLEINWRVNMDARMGIHAEDFGLPIMETWDVYYDLIKNDSQFEDILNQLKMNNESLTVGSLMEALKDMSEEELKDLASELSESMGEAITSDDIIGMVSSAPGSTKESYKENSKIHKDYLKIIRDIENIGITATRSINENFSYFKINNRRNNPDNLVMPGLSLDNNNRTNVDVTPTLFVDYSGSMDSMKDSIINIIKKCVRNKFRVIIYNSGIERIIEPGQSYDNVFNPRGGNDLEKAYGEYLKENTKLENIIIITDGGEPCLFQDCFSIISEKIEPSDIRHGIFFDENKNTSVYILPPSLDSKIIKATARNIKYL